MKDLIKYGHLIVSLLLYVIVDWAKDSPEVARSSVYVTSDRELKDRYYFEARIIDICANGLYSYSFLSFFLLRLVAAGGLVVKPKQWVGFAMRVLEKDVPMEETGSLDSFIEKWSALHIH